MMESIESKVMIIRKLTTDDTENFFQMMCCLDEETQYMLYEPGERREKTKDLSRLRSAVEEAASGQDLLLGAVSDAGEIVGFLWAEKGRLNRVLHTAYIVVGIREAWRHQGIGTQFFDLLDEWAKATGVVRLELTVECENTAAKSLYEKCGFNAEGIREKSMKVNGRLVDEYYMGKITG